ncbi:MAG: LacI family DNA-binding transcriptional regulator [Oscillospiraceae bacterium]
MAITSQEIAKLAGVSRGTVDRALKGRAGINPETKERILKICKEHNYTPNIIGKALAYSGHSIKVVVILNSVGNSFFDEVKRGIYSAEAEFSTYGIEIELIEFKGYQADSLLKILNELPSDVGNVILTPINDISIEEKINQMAKDGVNVVTVSNDIETANRLSYVGCDYLKSGKIAGKLVELLSGGKANLCIVTGSCIHTGHLGRVEGIKSVIKSGFNDINILGVIENDDDNEKAYEITKDFIKKNPTVDFIYITAGGVSGTVRAIKESKKNIKTCSFDDTKETVEALLSGDILATICQQPYEQGYYAVKVIFDKVVAKKTIEEIQHCDLFIKVDKSL